MATLYPEGRTGLSQAEGSRQAFNTTQGEQQVQGDQREDGAFEALSNVTGTGTGLGRGSEPARAM